MLTLFITGYVRETIGEKTLFPEPVIKTVGCYAKHRQEAVKMRCTLGLEPSKRFVPLTIGERDNTHIFMNRETEEIYFMLPRKPMTECWYKQINVLFDLQAFIAEYPAALRDVKRIRNAAPCGVGALLLHIFRLKPSNGTLSAAEERALVWMWNELTQFNC